MKKKKEFKWYWHKDSFSKGLKVSDKMSGYHIVAEFSEKVAENQHQYNLLKQRKKYVDKEVYEKIIMSPTFIMHFINIYNKKRADALRLLEYLDKQTPGNAAKLETIRRHLKEKMRKISRKHGKRF